MHFVTFAFLDDVLHLGRRASSIDFERNFFFSFPLAQNISNQPKHRFNSVLTPISEFKGSDAFPLDQIFIYIFFLCVRVDGHEDGESLEKFSSTSELRWMNY